MITAANNTPSQEELEIINTYTRNPLSAEDVYCFNLTLCDNEVDRDFERFSLEALKGLCELFPGKTGICDHDMSTKNQKARIFRTWLEQDKSKKTSQGESYVALRAKAYMLRTKENEELINQIEGGIKKEISVGCSMKSLTCSICSKDMKSHECNHHKGRHYGNKLCHGILNDASDAYEWSFVAVPAQKNAGVTKTFSVKETKSSAERSEKSDYYSKEYVLKLEALAEEAAMYKAQLKKQIRKYALISMPLVDIDTFTKAFEALGAAELEKIAEDLRSQAEAIMPVSLQLKALTDKKTPFNNNAFKI